jgi:alpha-1,3-mannosyl-glycoprotein beta-1,2-N-acetylglucosaminyltransferase
MSVATLILTPSRRPRPVAPLLYQDASLLTVSAFNDNGQPRYASDETAVHRSNFFPGLGWLLTRRLWDELDAKWPEEKGFWDDWM